MSKMLSELLLAVVTAAIPVLSAYLIKLINELKDKAAAQTDSIKLQDYFSEIARCRRSGFDDQSDLCRCPEEKW